jgi:hypothetical protein
VIEISHFPPPAPTEDLDLEGALFRLVIDHRLGINAISKGNAD